MKEILTSCPSDGPSLPPPTSVPGAARQVTCRWEGDVSTSHLHLQSLNGSEYDRNLPSAVLSTCLVSGDPRIGERFTVVETEAAGRGGNAFSSSAKGKHSSK